MAVASSSAPEQVQTVSAPEAPTSTLPDPDWNWRHLPRRGDTDPDTARQARALRIRWRREHPAAWRTEIESLFHYQPEYPYDEGYEYDEDFTTDPNYGSDAAVLPYDPEGFVTAEPPLHGFGPWARSTWSSTCRPWAGPCTRNRTSISPRPRGGASACAPPAARTARS